MSLQGKVWGETREIIKKNNTELHEIHIKKGGYCSKHLHKTKYNLFYVISGLLKVIIYMDRLEDITIIKPSQQMIVPPGFYHRFEALEDTQAIEFYWAELNEIDIYREDTGGLKNEASTNLCTQSETKPTLASIIGRLPQRKWEHCFD